MHPTSASRSPSKKSFAEPEPRHIRRGLKRLEPATKGTRENVFASLNLRDRSCYTTFSREDRRTCSKGQLYTYRRPDNILWFQRIRQRMGFAERRAEGIWARRFGRHSIERAGCLFLPVTLLACLVEPLAIHLDPTEPSGDMDYTFSLRRTRRLRAAMRG